MIHPQQRNYHPVSTLFRNAPRVYVKRRDNYSVLAVLAVLVTIMLAQVCNGS